MATSMGCHDNAITKKSAVNYDDGALVEYEDNISGGFF